MTNLEIAQKAALLPIQEIADRLSLPNDHFEPLGRHKAKLTYEGMAAAASKKRGKLVLVTAMTPTPAGEGKTTSCVGLAQGLNRIGRLAVPAIREPAMGPIFGIKGGACGGGFSQVVPMEDINLAFTGDFPAIVAAHNLLSAMLDAHIMHGNAATVDVRNISWPRTLDMNDRALREVIVGLGGKSNGYPREDGFVVAPASEVMAILCLSRTIAELKERLGRIVVALTPDNRAVTAADIKANGAMAAILRDAIRPNIVQTIENGPAFVHGGPFGNIAHGCSSVIATECALGLADFVVTEAGFGADLGAEKFMNIVCRTLGRGPDVVVLVGTVRAMKHHGDGDISVGIQNLLHHARHLTHYGIPLVLSINSFPTDTKEEHDQIVRLCDEAGFECVVSDPWGSGGSGCEELAEAVDCASKRAGHFKHLYDLDHCECQMLKRIAAVAYKASGCEMAPLAVKHIEWAHDHGYPNLPVCVAKTQYSLSDDSRKKNVPSGHTLHVRDMKLSAGAGFMVAHAGDILLMPGLGKEPTAYKIDVDENGKISGLF